MNDKEFSPKLGWQRLETRSAIDDLEYPDEPDFQEESPLTLQFDDIQNVSIGVINRVPLKLGKTPQDNIYEEYVVDTELKLNPLVGFNRMKKHIAKGRTINFGFIAKRDGYIVNVLFVSVDGDEPRMFVRTLK